MTLGAKAVKNLGHDVLLTQAELDCYRLALRYHRKSLAANIFSLCAPLKYLLKVCSSWSAGPLKALLQLLLMTVLLPVLLLWQLLLCLFRLLLFPLQYLLTYRLPRDLAAPGEKNMAGIHNAFARHFHLPVALYVECFDGWVEILYGPELYRQYSLSDQLKAEKARCGTEQKHRNCDVSEDYMRTFLSHARERLSRKLGHYLSQ